MKKGLLLFVLAFCGMSLFATDPTFSYGSASRRDIIVDGGGTAISNIAVVVDAGCPIVPWKVEVSGSTKTTTSDTTVFTPTNYVGTMTGVHTNWFTVASTNSVNGFVLTNEVATSTITNRFTSLRGLDLSAWDIVATNGVSETVSAGSLRFLTGQGHRGLRLTLRVGALAARMSLTRRRLPLAGRFG
jgi:hypothetical protein